MKKIFFITPIGNPNSVERRDSDFVMKTFLEPVAEKLGFDILRSDLLNNSGKIDDTIVQQIERSEIVVIDLTGLNPNVMFEFGIRYGLSKPFIAISQDVNTLPLDVRNIRTLEYTVTAPDIESITERLEAMIKIEVENVTSQSSSAKLKGEQLGEEMLMKALQSGDFSQIENMVLLADKLGLDSSKK
ncbi:hypothetical protein [Enterococcus sp. LJL90]